MLKKPRVYYRTIIISIFHIMLVFIIIGCGDFTTRRTGEDEPALDDIRPTLTRDERQQKLYTIFESVEDEMKLFITHLTDNNILDSFNRLSIRFNRDAEDAWRNPPRGIWFTVFYWNDIGRSSVAKGNIVNDEKLYSVLRDIFDHGIIHEISAGDSSETTSVTFSIHSRHTSKISNNGYNFRFIMNDDGYDRPRHTKIRDGWYILIDYVLDDGG